VCGFGFFFNLLVFFFCAKEREVRNGKVNKIKYGNIATVWRALKSICDMAEVSQTVSCTHENELKQQLFLFL